MSAVAIAEPWQPSGLTNRSDTAAPSLALENGSAQGESVTAPVIYGDVLRTNGDSPALTSSDEYEDVRDRMSRFRGLELSTIRRAWWLLNGWERTIRHVYHRELSPPWVFADGEGRVVFEWEAPDRNLEVRIPQAGDLFLEASIEDTEEDLSINAFLVDERIVVFSLLSFSSASIPPDA